MVCFVLGNPGNFWDDFDQLVTFGAFLATLWLLSLTAIQVVLHDFDQFVTFGGIWYQFWFLFYWPLYGYFL